MNNVRRRYLRFSHLGLFICVMVISGCKVGPDYKLPEPNVPAKWVGPAMAAESNLPAATEQDLVHWWTTFGDPNLTLLVERSVKSNLNLRQAEVRIQQARAARGIVAAGFWPAASATGSASRSHSAGTTGSLYQAGLDASWELDIFGGIRRDIEAANADIQAAVEDQRDVLVTLTAEVALNYIDLRSFQQQIVIAQNNLEAQKQTAEVTRKRFLGGFVGALDVANADSQVATTASTIPLLESAARQTIYNISILLGQEPAALLEELSASASIPPVPPSVPAGVPSDLLQRRPDIRRAEARIHAATARIGVATSDLFPKFLVSASGGTQGNKFNSLSNWDNRFWSYGGLVDWQIFSAGSIRSNIELQKYIQKEQLLAYQQTVLTALQDVENALIASAKEQEHRESLIEAVSANRKAVELATKLYTEGETDFLNVLDAQRSLFVSEDALVRSTGAVSTNLVALYKALGGGWND
jgi:multidrug efflux system outer membrane protein